MSLLQNGKCVLALNRGDRRRLNDQWEKKSSEKIRRAKTHFPYCSRFFTSRNSTVEYYRKTILAKSIWLIIKAAFPF